MGFLTFPLPKEIGIQIMKTIFNLLIASLVVILPALIDNYLPTIDFFTPSMEMLINLIK